MVVAVQIMNHVAAAAAGARRRTTMAIASAITFSETEMERAASRGLLHFCFSTLARVLRPITVYFGYDRDNAQSGSHRASHP